jgi:hypothetical protein
MTAASTLSVVNALTAGSTLSVANAMTAAGTLSVVNALTAGSTLSVANAMTAASTLSVVNAMTVGSGLFINSNGLTVYGNTELQIAANTFSDRRLKKDLKPLVDPLSRISRIRGVYYNWIDDDVSGMTFDKKRRVGLIAQEVQRVLPEAVSSMGDYLGLDYTSLIPLLIEGVRALDKRTSQPTKVSESLLRLSENLVEGNDEMSEDGMDYEAILRIVVREMLKMRESHDNLKLIVNNLMTNNKLESHLPYKR